MGGFVIQKYLEGHDVPGAVLLSSPPPDGLLKTIIRIARRHPLVFAKTNLTCNLKYIVATPALLREAFFSADIPEDELMHYFKQVQNESYMAMLDMAFFSRPEPAKVKTPLLILGASRDNMLDIRQIQACAKAYNTEAEIIPDVAHNSMLEQHWKNVADRILVWLKSNLVMNESREMLQRVHDKLSVGPMPVNR
jgi:pimeloyl-ACP methyl ester carboxylesterase